MRTRAVLLAFTLLLLPALPALAQLRDPVRVRGGQLAGAPGTDATVRVYRGVPFAAPPVGDLRWRPPQAPPRWEGVRPATDFSPGCLQPLARSRPPWTEPFMVQHDASEDCLYLNVWTAARSATAKRPVLVYVHGGGFNEGSGAVAVYDGEALAKKGLVVVTINYRLGVLGFLAHPELTAESGVGASGNYGLLDQVAALQWVRENIAAFGGDPGNVTVAGQSAGAMSVYLLTASPLARGLFHGAIVQSGPGGLASFGLASTRSMSRPLADAQADGTAFAQARGAASLRDLRALPADSLMAPLPGRPPLRFGPVVDGFFLPDDLAELYARGEQHDVPMLTGFNADEASAFPGYGKSTVEAYQKQAKERYGDASTTFLSLYAASTDEDAGNALKASMRDVGFVALARLAAERAATARTNAYLYYFERGIPWPEHPEFGAFHTAEVPYVFDNLAVLDRPWEAVDRRLAALMSSYWVNFATTGDPNGAGLPAWPAFSPDRPVFMVLGANPEARVTPDAARRAFFDAQLRRAPGR